MTDLGTDLHHLPGKFMSRNKEQGHEIIAGCPFIDMNVNAAQASGYHSDQDIRGTDLGPGFFRTWIPGSRLVLTMAFIQYSARPAF
jgi:hypothetical protein